jgi:WXG100 family type VII secretion target
VCASAAALRVPTLGDMSDFAVVVASVGQTASRTAAVGSDLVAELIRLRRTADDVLTAGWRGPAAAAFERGWSCWDVAAREVVGALEELAELLHETGRAYELCDVASSDGLRLAVL